MYLEVDIIENLNNYFNVFLTLDFFGWISAVIEILLISLIVYRILIWVKNTRAWTIMRGLIVIGIFILIAVFFNFSVIIYILKGLIYVSFFALIIIFQDDLRHLLEHLGRQKVFEKILPDLNKLTKKTSDTTVQKISEAVFAMAQVRTGALIVIEQSESLEDIEKTGIAINGEVSKQLLINIFEKNTPLHDGAVLIVGDIIKAATCYLPLSHDYHISKDLGTRHRAALGISEISDSQTIVVSEETGNVSLCSHGRLTIMKDEKDLIKNLNTAIYSQEYMDENKNESGLISTMKGWLKHEK